MQPDNNLEQEVPHIDGKETAPQPVKPETDKIQEGQKRLETASDNLEHELDELVTSSPDVDLSEESRLMDKLRAEGSGLAETVLQDSGISINTEHPVTDRSELFHMQGVKERWYKEQLGGYEIIPVDEDGNNLGYVLRSQEQPPVKGDWILTDLDDTMIGTQEVKSQREQLYGDYLKKAGVELPLVQLESIIKSTDKFARWQDTVDGSKDCYHPIAHMMAMQMVTDALFGLGPESSDASKREAAINGVYSKIAGIKTQLDTNESANVGDPFRFNAEKKFVIRKIPPWSPEIETIFKQTMVTPPRYEKNIGAFVDDEREKQGSVDVVNKGVFTSGVPSYQLHKMGELLRENPDLKFNTMLFTRVPKDKFLKKYIEQEGIRDSVIVMYDDSIGNVRSLENLNAELSEQTGNTIVGVVAKTPFAKDAGATSELPTLDHSSMSQKDIKTGLQIALEERDKQRFVQNKESDETKAVTENELKQT